LFVIYRLFKFVNKTAIHSSILLALLVRVPNHLQHRLNSNASFSASLIGMSRIMELCNPLQSSRWCCRFVRLSTARYVLPSSTLIFNCSAARKFFHLYHCSSLLHFIHCSIFKRHYRILASLPICWQIRDQNEWKLAVKHAFFDVELA